VLATLDGFLERMRAVPGVVSVGSTTLMPLGGGRVNTQAIFVEGDEKPDDAPAWSQITPGFFETMGTPLVRGRYFDDGDDVAAPGVVIVDERLANHFWPGADPLGKRLFMPGVSGNEAVATESTKWLTVVGVVPEIRLYSLAGGETSAGSYYTPVKQGGHRYYDVAIKSPLDTALIVRALRAELAAVDPELVPLGVWTMVQRANLMLSRERLAMGIAVAFGGVALFLSALGIYGVLAYLVAQRSHEIGVRMALGSTVRQVFTLVLREGLALVAFGLVLGVAGVLLLGRALQGLVYGVAPTNPVLIVLVASVLAGTALAASVLPARRATRVNPVVVLNAQ
jgi:predicted permease